MKKLSRELRPSIGYPTIYLELIGTVVIDLRADINHYAAVPYRYIDSEGNVSEHHTVLLTDLELSSCDGDLEKLLDMVVGKAEYKQS